MTQSPVSQRDPEAEAAKQKSTIINFITRATVLLLRVETSSAFHSFFLIADRVKLLPLVARLKPACRVILDLKTSCSCRFLG